MTLKQSYLASNYLKTQSIMTNLVRNESCFYIIGKSHC